MNPTAEFQDEEEQWRVCATTITPCDNYTQSLNAFCAANRSDDFGIRFIFTCHTTTNDPEQDFIHASRLSFAKGPLAALLSTYFAEGSTRTVTLCSDDDPATFAIIRDFLYGLQISLYGVELPRLLRVLRSAHRWQLVELFRVLCAFVSTHDMLCDARTLLMAVDIVALPGLPRRFRDYFWESAAKFFMEFSPPGFGRGKVEDVEREGKVSEQDKVVDNWETEEDGRCLPVHIKLCPCFPDMWDLALSHGAVGKLIKDIRRPNVPGLNADLLDLVMRYLEQRIQDDDEVFELIELLGPDAMREEYLLQRCGVGDDCSARAVRLLARSLIAPTCPRNEMSFSWDVSLSTITPCRQNFLYGPCVPATRGPRSRWDPNLFDASSSIHFNVETVVNPGKQVLLNVRWDVGTCFPFKGRKMELSLVMVKRDLCEEGSESKSALMPKVERIQFKMSRIADLTQRTCAFSEVATDEVFDAADHSSLNAVRYATMVLRVRLIDD